jgi:hypothetical protein
MVLSQSLHHAAHFHNQYPLLETSTMPRPSATSTRLLLTLLATMILAVVSAWSPQTTVSRRDWFQQTVATTTAAVVVGGTLFSPQIATAAPSSSSLLIDELTVSQSKLAEIPALLQLEDWEKVRNILKTPPVNKLWNLGDSQNIILQLAKETGNVELFETKDDVALNLQMCDQVTYANVFIYFQPGSGKINIKDPTDFVQKAISQIKQVIDDESSN